MESLIDQGGIWFESNGWTVFPFQKETWQAYLNGQSGLVNAPTGSGKTYALFIGCILEELSQNNLQSKKGLKLIWVTPIRALAKEIQISAVRAIEAFGLDWEVAIRSGDTTTTQRQNQWKRPPQVLITTPESIHVMLSTKGYPTFFEGLSSIVVDEWHELLGSKRGVLTELAISRLYGMQPSLKVWGISATIGNMEEAIDVLLNPIPKHKRTIIKADIDKKITVESVMPAEIEEYPWAGHLGIRMLDDVMPIIDKSKTTLIFTNTRSQCEIWYQRILDKNPDLAGIIAMHHGSISRELRDWVEEALYEGRLKAVVCTSSLDLGVDFRPVETIIQIGSPKGVARFVQRAGRSGHQPGAESKIYFVPTHSMELVEAAALRRAINNHSLEERIPYIRSFDVLIQYLMTLAVSEGFRPETIYKEISKTYCFESIEIDEWLQVLNFLVNGSESLSAYDEYHKVLINQGLYVVEDPKIAQRHRMSIGTIVSDAMLQVRFISGKSLGSVEEGFISRLEPGDVFWFAGRPLELVRIKEMTVQVRPSKRKSGRIPAYSGGRLPLSSEMSKVLKEKLYDYVEGIIEDVEVQKLVPLFEVQQRDSLIPRKDEFLVEYFKTKDGYHLLMYPFEGRQVHEGMGALLAKRLSRLAPISFSLAMNDYGFEMLSDREMDVELVINDILFSTVDLAVDIQASINAVEMCRRRFRDIARISGLIFQGYPGKPKKNRHLQSSAQLLFDVFRDYEPNNLLFMQTYDEVMTFQLEEARLRSALERIQSQNIIISTPHKPTPFSFPIIVDRLSRERLTSETMEDRIKKMRLQLEM